jgi:hypothetical protein
MANGTTVTKNSKANSRDAILDAAERLFANSGFDTSMRSIAEAAGVAQGLLHYHFGKNVCLPKCSQGARRRSTRRASSGLTLYLLEKCLASKKCWIRCSDP